jgi:serine/threonine protein kinase
VGHAFPILHWLSFAPWDLPKKESLIPFPLAGTAELFLVSPPEAVVYLKGINILFGEDGRLKVLDFGLAKVADVPGCPNPATQITADEHTQEGKILGTAAYMSPEQAEGKPVDTQSDVFSMGIILYEMATGQRPFKGDTHISILSSILRDTPTPINDLNRSLPHHLGRIIRRCLVKDPNRRYQSAIDLRDSFYWIAPFHGTPIPHQVARIFSMR